jgi:hypothetical protein
MATEHQGSFRSGRIVDERGRNQAREVWAETLADREARRSNSAKRQPMLASDCIAAVNARSARSATCSFR